MFDARMRSNTIVVRTAALLATADAGELPSHALETMWQAWPRCLLGNAGVHDTPVQDVTAVLTMRGHDCYSPNGHRTALSARDLDSCAHEVHASPGCGPVFEWDTASNWCGCGQLGTPNAHCQEQPTATSRQSASLYTAHSERVTLLQAGHDCYSQNGNRKNLAAGDIASCAVAAMADPECGIAFEFDMSTNYCGCGMAGTKNFQCLEFATSNPRQVSSLYSLQKARAVLMATGHDCWTPHGNRKDLVAKTVDGCAAETTGDPECGSVFEFDKSNMYCGCGKANTPNRECQEDPQESSRPTSSLYRAEVIQPGDPTMWRQLSKQEKRLNAASREACAETCAQRAPTCTWWSFDILSETGAFDRTQLRFDDIRSETEAFDRTTHNCFLGASNETLRPKQGQTGGPAWCVPPEGAGGLAPLSQRVKSTLEQMSNDLVQSRMQAEIQKLPKPPRTKAEHPEWAGMAAFQREVHPELSQPSWEFPTAPPPIGLPFAEPKPIDSEARAHRGQHDTSVDAWGVVKQDFRNIIDDVTKPLLPKAATEAPNPDFYYPALFAKPHNDIYGGLFCLHEAEGDPCADKVCDGKGDGPCFCDPCPACADFCSSDSSHNPVWTQKLPQTWDEWLKGAPPKEAALTGPDPNLSHEEDHPAWQAAMAKLRAKMGEDPAIPIQPCPAQILVSGVPAFQAERNGVFDLTTIDPLHVNDRRSIFKKGSMYLYYSRGLRVWVIGPDYAKQQGAMVSNDGGFHCPQEVEQWFYWTGQKMGPGPSIKVAPAPAVANWMTDLSWNKILFLSLVFTIVAATCRLSIRVNDNEHLRSALRRARDMKRMFERKGAPAGPLLADDGGSGGAYGTIQNEFGL